MLQSVLELADYSSKLADSNPNSLKKIGLWVWALRLDNGGLWRFCSALANLHFFVLSINTLRRTIYHWIAKEEC